MLHRSVSVRFMAALVQCMAIALLATPTLSAHGVGLRVASWASLDADAAVAPHSAAVVEGEFADRTTRAPDGVPVPELDSITVEIEGSDHLARLAGILAVGPRRVVFRVPDVPEGGAHLRVLRGETELAAGEFRVQSVSPGLFSAAATGGGLAAAVAVRVNLADGSGSVEDVAFYNDERGAFEPVLLNPAVEGSELYLELQGTGIRRAAEVSVEIGGMIVPSALEPETGSPSGIDRVTAGPLPVALAQRQIVEVTLTADGIRSNAVQVAFSPSAGPALTFSNQIVRLFQARCQTCHRPGEVAPFSLLDYEPARVWAASIKQATQTRSMPPWKAVPGHGEFAGERRLSEAEIDLVARWVDAGAPEGDPSDLPEPLVFDPDWQEGEPDLIIPTPEYLPDPNLSDEYRCFSFAVPDEITERKSITKVEVRPGNRQIVHHVILYGDPAGESVALEGADTSPDPGYECFGGPGISFNGFALGVDSYFLGLWAPGGRAQVLPENTGYALRPGSHVVLQVHYHPDGSGLPDSTRVGLHFSDEPTNNNALVLAAINTDFVIPAGAERHEVRAAFSLDPIPGLQALLEALDFFPVNILGVAPHMHLLGREIRMDKVSATGEVTPMIRIDDWDFDWQSEYSYVEPVQFHAGDRLEVLAVYDNSANNPKNPNDPPIPVAWGDRSSDEMCIVFFLVEIPDLCSLGFCGD